MQRWVLGGVGVLGLGASLFLAGCPGNLDQPDRFEGDASPTPSGTAGTAGAGAVIVPIPACVTTILTSPTHGCVQLGCHSGGGVGADNLDLSGLTGANVSARLVNVAATHADVSAPLNVCSPVKLIDTQNPANSWLLLKLNGGQGMCGLAMPEIGGMLVQSDLDCMTSWVNSFATGAGTGTGGASSVGGSGGSGGSTATTAMGGTSTSGGTGGSSAGGTSTGGTSAGGTSAGGSSAGGASSGGSSASGGRGGASSGGRSGGSGGRGGTSGKGGSGGK